MQLFVGEFITGGGLHDQVLPVSLAKEGDIILQALLNDLQETGDVDLLTTRDPRLEPLTGNLKTKIVTGAVDHCWSACLAESDAAIIIAPETDGALYHLTKLAIDQGCSLIGSSLEAVSLTSSKRQTLEHLESHNIPVVPVLDVFSSNSSLDSVYVIKPDDGVGAEGCYLFTDIDALHQYLEHNAANFIVQLYTVGISASLSLLCFDGHCRLLAVNEQLFEFSDGKGELHGIVVNGIARTEPLMRLAEDIAAAIPGLRGYVGVDLILTPDGPRVLEINPRLTTAYAGLRLSLGQNPAEWLLSMHQFQQLPDIHGLQYRPITIKLERT